MEQQTDSKLGKEYVKAVYCHPAYLIYMQSTSVLNGAQAGIKEKAEEPEIKLPTSIRSSKSKRVPEKHLLLPYQLHQRI